MVRAEGRRDQTPGSGKFVKEVESLVIFHCNLRCHVIKGLGLCSLILIPPFKSFLCYIDSSESALMPEAYVGWWHCCAVRKRVNEAECDHL